MGGPDRAISFVLMEYDDLTLPPAPLPIRPVSATPMRSAIRATPTPSRRGVLLRYLIVLAVVGGAGVAVEKYIERRGTDPTSARRLIEQEIKTGAVLEPGETIEARADLLQRHWSDYYRPTPTTLLATDRRLLLLMVPPKVLPPAAWDPVPASVEQHAMAYDSVSAREARIFFGTATGLLLRVRAEQVSLAAYPGELSRMRTVERNIRRHEVERQIAVDREHQLQREAETKAKEAIYHAVQPGEAIGSIADLYGITPARLRELNSITGDKIKVGQKLLVKPQT